MAHAKVAGVSLEQPYLLVAEHDRLVLDLFFQPQQPPVALREIVPEPDPSHARRAHVYALKAQLVGDALGAPGRTLKAQGQYLLLDLGSHTVRMRALRTAFLFHKSA